MRKVLILLTAFCAIGINQFAEAQTQDQMHQQKASAEQHLNAIPSGNVEKSFFEVYGTPKTLFDEGKQIDFLFAWTSWASAGFFLIVWSALIYFVIFNRYRDNKRAYYTHGTGKRDSLIAYFFDILIFITLDIVVWIASFQATGSPFGDSDFGFIWNAPSVEESVRVQVMPQQWAWNFRYAGKDKEFDTSDDIYSINELVVPKGKPVLIQIKSRDVIHGFWIPNVRMQMDALPGQVSRMWFNTNDTGNYEIVCAHLCGTNHYKMKAFLKVIEEDDFNGWENEMSEWATASYDQERKNKHYWGWTWGL